MKKFLKGFFILLYIFYKVVLTFLILIGLLTLLDQQKCSIKKYFQKNISFLENGSKPKF